MVVDRSCFRWLLCSTVLLAVHVLLTTRTRVQSAPESIHIVESSPRLYLYIPSWMEGMSSWMISLSEVLVLAKELNATLVEPCIKKGRLGSCASVASGGHGLRLSQVLDLELMRQYHTDIVTYEEYMTAISATEPSTVPVVSLCLHHFSPNPFCRDAPLVYGAKWIPQFREALTLARNTTTVMEIHQYSRYGFRKSKWINGSEAAMVKAKYLALSPLHGERVTVLLERMGIPHGETFSVLHWRAEHPDMDYLACADKILEARDTMRKRQKQKQQQPFILMSSLNTNADYMWKGAKLMAENSTSDQALQRLLDHGFMKLDQVIDYPELQDPMMLAVYDLILAMKATKFVTCSKRCSDDSVCAACNWRGQFAGLAVSMRRDVENKSSTECWPSMSATR